MTNPRFTGYIEFIGNEEPTLPEDHLLARDDMHFMVKTDEPTVSGTRQIAVPFNAAGVQLYRNFGRKFTEGQKVMGTYTLGTNDMPTATALLPNV